ncbi:hypothetical protein CEXT_482671 [Caerostris extrusa]|uniref:Uncharacterized protein n=1 Tax=Caerostris extrusa TaxID=172846 RepID=A0AAV4U256_CAEEX|nr:hypothetical protein CEXT_482671 [Caerostris extrusa]
MAIKDPQRLNLSSTKISTVSEQHRPFLFHLFPFRMSFYSVSRRWKLDSLWVAETCERPWDIVPERKPSEGQPEARVSVSPGR